MVLYKCCFGPLWITTLMLSYYVLLVGGQTLGSLAKSRCFRGCFITTCPSLEANCVCSRFGTALGMAEIWTCAWSICPVADVVAGFLALGDECPSFISTATGRNRRSFSTTPVPPSPTPRSPSRSPTSPTPNSAPTASATSRLGSLPTRTQPTNTPTSSSSRTSSSGSSYSTRWSSTSSGCTTSTPIIGSSPTSTTSTYIATTVQPGSSTPPTPSTSTQTSATSMTSSGNTLPNGAQADQMRNLAIVALVLGLFSFLTALLAIFLVLRQRQGRNRRSITSFTGIVDFEANQRSISAPLPTRTPTPPRVPLAEIGARPTTRGSQMSAGTGAGAVTAVATARRESIGRESISRESTGRESTVAVTPVPGPSQGSSQLYIFPPASRRLPVTQRQPPSQQSLDLRLPRKPLPQLPRLPEEARIRPGAGPGARGIPMGLPPTVYPIEDTPRPMSAISELAEVDRYQPILDDATEVEFRRVYQDVRKAFNRSPSTSTDQNSTDWSIMTDLSRNSTTRSFRPEG